MKNTLKKAGYFTTLLFLSSIIIAIYYVFFTNQPTPNHTMLPLQPVTQREQQDLIAAQEDTEGVLETTGPLVAHMNAADAQAQVLN